MIKFLRKNFLVCFVLASIFCVCLSALSYGDKITHPALTEQAVFLYNKNADEKISSEETEWIKKGSIEEDILPRPWNHFYDPIYKAPLKKDINGLPVKTSIAWAHSSIAQTAPIIGKGDYTWESAIYYYQQGDKEKAYIALGHILHLLEDMAVPAHTRDDAHIFGDPYETWVDDYIRDNALNFNVSTINNCASLEQCFSELAYYTNTNFFSVDTVNSDKYVLPKIKESKVSKTVDGRKFEFHYNSQGLVVALSDYSESNWYDVINKNNEDYVVDDNLIHQSYFSILAPKAVSYGAGLIKLFEEEVKKEQEAEPLTWWENKIEGIKNDIASLGNIFKKTETVVKNEVEEINKNTNSNLDLLASKKVDMAKLASDVKDMVEEKGDVLGEEIKKLGDENEDKTTFIKGLTPPLLPSMGELTPSLPSFQPEAGATIGEHNEDALIQKAPIRIENGQEIRKEYSKPVEQGEIVKVKYVIDGDTIDLEDGRRVRYIGVDTPELNKPNLKDDDECLAWVARERNRALLEKGKEITLFKDSGGDKDKYGRFLRYVYSDSVFLNRVLANEGLGKTFFCKKYMQNCPVMEDMEKIAVIEDAGNNAEKEKRGIFSGICEEYEKLRNLEIEKLNENISDKAINDNSKNFDNIDRTTLKAIGGQTLPNPILGGGENIGNTKLETGNLGDAGAGEGVKDGEEDGGDEDKKDIEAPNSIMENLPNEVNDNFEIKWNGEDQGENASGIAYFDLLYYATTTLQDIELSLPEDELVIEWQEFETATTATSTIFDIKEYEDGTNLCFMVRAVDNAGNVEEWPQHTPCLRRQANPSPEGSDSHTFSSEQIKRTKINLTVPNIPNIEYPENGMIITTDFITASGTSILADIGKTVVVEIIPPLAPPYQGGETIIDENGNWKIENIELQTGSSAVSAYVVEEDGDESERVSVNVEKVDNDEYLTVVMNEIAWMGTSKTNYQDEWIELYNNTGFELDIAGWKLQATDGTPNIELAGKIEPYGYYLLERTDDTTINDIDADQIYTGELGNSGEILELRDSDNNLIDYINCSLDWHSGKNSPKMSMERINPMEEGNKNNWADNNTKKKNGLDAGNEPINGTPRALNSATSAGNILPHKPLILSGSIKENTTLTKANSPYILWVITVEENVVLTIEAGTIVKVISAGNNMNIKGKLNINGTKKWPVVFTSWKDDLYGGNTDDAYETGGHNEPKSFDWGGIQFSSEQDSSINNALFRYGGRGGRQFIDVNETKVDIYDSVFEYVSATYHIDAVKYTNSVGSEFKRNIVRESGMGLEIWGGDIEIEGNEFSNNLGVAISLMDNTARAKIGDNKILNNNNELLSYFVWGMFTRSPYFELSGNTIEGNGFNGICLDLDLEDVDIVLPKAIYYNFMTTVRENASLTILPGTIFRNSIISYFDVYGKLVVAGEEDNKVVFTSIYDKSQEAGGDVIGRYDDNEDKFNYWEGIFIRNPEKISTIKNATIRYGGRPLDNNAKLSQIGVFGGKLAIENTVISDSYGGSQNIYMLDGELDILNSYIKGNPVLPGYPTGININGNSFVNIAHSGFEGIHCGVESHSDNIVNAKNNWWGDKSGPYDFNDDRATGGLYNPEGIGVMVTDGVDYQEWLEEEPF